jgi:hypothetical protein
VGLSIKSVLGEIDMMWCDKKNLSIRQGKGKGKARCGKCQGKV